MAPLVSISPAPPPSVSAVASPASCRACSSGSPPVITISRAGWPSAQASTLAVVLPCCSALRSNLVQSHVQGVSHPRQDNRQPDTRGKDATPPAGGPPPCRLRPHQA